MKSVAAAEVGCGCGRTSEQTATIENRLKLQRNLLSGIAHGRL